MVSGACFMHNVLKCSRQLAICSETQDKLLDENITGSIESWLIQFRFIIGRNKVCQDCLASLLYHIDQKSGASVHFLVPIETTFELQCEKKMAYALVKTKLLNTS